MTKTIIRVKCYADNYNATMIDRLGLGSVVFVKGIINEVHKCDGSYENIVKVNSIEIIKDDDEKYQVEIKD